MWVVRTDRQRKSTHNSTSKKLAVQCYAYAFVVNQTLVLRINICGKNRQLLVAAKRQSVKKLNLSFFIQIPARLKIHLSDSQRFHFSFFTT